MSGWRNFTVTVWIRGPRHSCPVGRQHLNATLTLKKLYTRCFPFSIKWHRPRDSRAEKLDETNTRNFISSFQGANNISSGLGKLDDSKTNAERSNVCAFTGGGETSSRDRSISAVGRRHFLRRNTALKGWRNSSKYWKKVVSGNTLRGERQFSRGATSVHLTKLLWPCESNECTRADVFFPLTRDVSFLGYYYFERRRPKEKGTIQWLRVCCFQYPFVSWFPPCVLFISRTTWLAGAREIPRQ